MQNQLPCTKKVYIAITHIRQLRQGRWQTTEEVEVTTNLKKRITEHASVIIDVMNQKFLKNRFMPNSSRPDEEHTAYLVKYIEEYKPQIQQVLAKSS